MVLNKIIYNQKWNSISSSTVFIFVYDLYLDRLKEVITSTLVLLLLITGPTDFFVFILWSESDLLLFFFFFLFLLFIFLCLPLAKSAFNTWKVFLFLVKVYIGVLLLDKTVFQLLCVVCVHPKQKSKLWKRWIIICLLVIFTYFFW